MSSPPILPEEYGLGSFEPDGPTSLVTVRFCGAEEIVGCRVMRPVSKARLEDMAQPKRSSMGRVVRIAMSIGFMVVIWWWFGGSGCDGEVKLSMRLFGQRLIVFSSDCDSEVKVSTRCLVQDTGLDLCLSRAGRLD